MRAIEMTETDLEKRTNPVEDGSEDGYGLGLALVDFHNFMQREDSASAVVSAAEDAVESVAAAFADSGNVAEVDIRLYGGWLDEAGHTSPNAATLLSALPQLRGRRKGMVVRPELATAMMVDPALRLHGTVRLRTRRRREKMVDQMIGCDAMFLAGSIGDRTEVVVFSSDDDLIPPMLMAHKTNPGRTRWVRRRSTLPRPNDQQLKRLGLHITER